MGCVCLTLCLALSLTLSLQVWSDAGDLLAHCLTNVLEAALQCCSDALRNPLLKDKASVAMSDLGLAKICIFACMARSTLPS